MSGEERRSGILRRSLYWVAGALAAVVFATYAFRHAGTWLVREDPAQKAQVVVVLSGGLPERAVTAADIYKSSGAREVWLTRPRHPGEEMQALHLPYAGEEQYSRMVLIDKGVPATAIRALDRQINNTADELEAIYAELEKRPGETVIAVTAKAHTRRVRAIWKHLSKNRERGQLVARAVPEDEFDAEHWWRSTNDALSVVREYLGLLNAWAGLPLAHTK